MDIEQLSKYQIVMLTLLVSFVTSIATGIVTVSLMDQAPPVIAQTVNRVIERTVESVAPAPKGQTASSVITLEKTVVVKESDLISQAVERISPSIVRIYSSATEAPSFLGLGIILDNAGTVVTDSSAFETGDVSLALSDGTRVRAFVSKRDTDNSLAFIQPATSTATTTIVWNPVTIASGHAVLGGTVVAISGKAVSRIAPGVIVAMPKNTIIDTNISSDSILSGSPLINTDGNVIGISTSESRSTSSSSFLSASVLLAPAQAKR